MVAVRVPVEPPIPFVSWLTRRRSSSRFIFNWNRMLNEASIDNLYFDERTHTPCGEPLPINTLRRMGIDDVSIQHFLTEAWESGHYCYPNQGDVQTWPAEGRGGRPRAARGAVGVGRGRPPSHRADEGGP